MHILQESMEGALVTIMQNATRLTVHRNRCTLSKQDMQVAAEIMNLNLSPIRPQPQAAPQEVRLPPNTCAKALLSENGIRKLVGEHFGVIRRPDDNQWGDQATDMRLTIMSKQKSGKTVSTLTKELKNRIRRQNDRAMKVDLMEVWEGLDPAARADAYTDIAAVADSPTVEDLLDSFKAGAFPQDRDFERVLDEVGSLGGRRVDLGNRAIRFSDSEMKICTVERVQKRFGPRGPHGWLRQAGKPWDPARELRGVKSKGREDNRASRVAVRARAAAPPPPPPPHQPSSGSCPVPALGAQAIKVRRAPKSCFSRSPGLTWGQSNFFTYFHCESVTFWELGEALPFMPGPRPRGPGN